MLKATIYFDNKIAADWTPRNWVGNQYLSVKGRQDLVHMKVEQGDWDVSLLPDVNTGEVQDRAPAAPLSAETTIRADMASRILTGLLAARTGFSDHYSPDLTHQAVKIADDLISKLNQRGNS